MQEREIKNILSSSYDFEKWHKVIDYVFPKVNFERLIVQLDDNSDKTKYIHQKGTIELTDGKKIIILEVGIKKENNIARSKVGFHNLTSKYIDQANNHGILVFYVSEDKSHPNYRLSFICKQSKFKEDGSFEEFKTNPKRYTYLLGINEICTTAAKRLKELSTKKDGFDFKLEDVIEAFSVEKLNDEFFRRYKEQFHIFSNYLIEDEKIRYGVFGINKYEKQEDRIDNELPIRDFTKRLLGRLVFLYFLQRKGWMGVSAKTTGNEMIWKDGYKDFVYRLFKEAKYPEKFHSKYLSALFYETLNNENREGFVFLIDGNTPFIDGIKRCVPYLNGGLFENNFLKGNKVDFPTNLFKSLFEFLEQYNFTIDENSPEDHEVGIDPEMLGHIFENLLEDNRDKGAYYTPKEVVHYMSQQSIIAYLNHKLNSNSNDIEIFIKENKISNYIKKHITDLNILLREVKVCDPAIGSGAFPMGILKVIYSALQILHNIVDDPENFDEAQTKRDIIQNSIYGVDLERGAVDIARLRFWLALVVDEDEPQPLPNLDYKIVSGNSLIHRYSIDIELNEAFKQFNKKVKSKDYDNQKIKDLLNNRNVDLGFYKEIVNDFLNVSSTENKEVFRELISEIKDAFKTTFSNKEKDKLAIAKGAVEKLKAINLFGKISGTKSQIVDAEKKYQKLLNERNKIFSEKIYKNAFEWRFEFPNLLNDEGWFTGFDIVIGNPPYIKEHTNRKAFDGIRDSPYFIGKMDIWHFFACYFIDMLKNNGGIQCFIAQNNWITSSGASKLRSKILKETQMISFIDFGNYKVFQNAGIQTMIYVVKKVLSVPEKYDVHYSRLFVDNIDKTFLDFFLQSSVDTKHNNFEKINFEFIPENYFNGYITFANDANSNILRKIQSIQSTKLLSKEVASGIDFTQDFLSKKNADKLGNDFRVGNGVFALSDNELKNLELNDNEKELIRPYFTTEQFGRFFAKKENKYWLIYTGSNFKNADAIIPYPNIKKHLDHFKDIITSDNKPYGLHRAREESFFKEKKILALRKCAGRPVFTYADFDTYVARPYLLIKTDRIDLKYLTALLNSKLIAFWLRNKGKMQGNNYQIDKEPLLKVPIVITDCEDIVAKIVDYVLLVHQPRKEQLIKYISNDLIIHSLEEVIDQIFYELYFGDELEMQELKILKYLKDLKPISSKYDDKDIEIVIGFYHWLHEQKNPIRTALLKANIVSKDIIGVINSTIT
ncbi:N-6 DNA methylase [Chryseobacterium sp. Leaf394]|uniref:Eco57I restriction-modification methylase domain-containing protein n=1 Tax=Chryseobacterium sp. Leaf394 TaxID=1736361 RepID=UPI00070035B7|nr:N-6 DNA methylase [Chryseobacterium sp. Leaf394]KQS93021.1 hypothetical protein ASG21_11495 [Chryseobacterium sp. Leaf394]